MANDAAYMREYMKRRYAERRAEALERLGGVCRRCGGGEDLQVDHIDRTQKTMKFERMTMVGRERWEAELAKCQLLCSPCHIDKTREYSDHFGNRPVAWALAEHGTGARYGRGCRCPACSQWRRLYRLGEVLYSGETAGTTIMTMQISAFQEPGAPWPDAAGATDSSARDEVEKPL